MSAIQNLINAWKDVEEGQILPDDHKYFCELEQELARSRRRDKNLFLRATRWQEPRMGDPAWHNNGGGKIHSWLGGIPYVGNLHNACIFLLMINPRATALDYNDRNNPRVLGIFKENRVQHNVKECFALGDIDKPEAEATSVPEGWVSYYRDGLFAPLIRQLNFHKRSLLAHKVAILELVPYFSVKADLINDDGLGIVQGRTVPNRNCPNPSELRKKGLPSSKLAIKAVKELAERRDCILITRWKNGARRWELADTQGAVLPNFRDKAVDWDGRNKSLPCNVIEKIRRYL